MQYAAMAGQGLQLVGGLAGGLGKSAGYNAQADAAEYNATMASQAAQQARDAGLASELATRRQSAQQMGQLRAAAAESGFNPSSGSMLQVQTDSARNAELDALQQRYVGLLRGTNYDNQAQIERFNAEGYRSQGGSSLGGTLLSSASQALSMANSGASLFGSSSAGGALGGGAAAGGGAGALSVSPAFAAGGTATSGLGAGGSLGSFAGGGGGSAASGGLGGSLAAAAPWAALAAVIVGNESYAKNHGYRRSGSDYYKDLATGRVLSQDVDNRWSPMLFGKSDRFGFGHDMSFAADIGSFQFGKAFKDLKKGTLGKIFKLF